MNALYHAFLPELLVGCALAGAMVLDMARLPARLSRALFLAAVGLAFVVLLHQLAVGFAAEPVPGEVAIDRIAMLGRLVVTGTAFGLALAFASAQAAKHWILLACSTLGGMLMLESTGFIPLFLGIELLSLPAFALVVLGRGETPSAEAALKYLVLSSVATALLLFGASIAYGATGSLAIGAWMALVTQGGALAHASVLLVLSGLFLKAAVFPFHGWAPDAYEGARLPVTAILASLVKGAVVLAFARLLGALPLEAGIAAIVAILAIASIFFGNLAALRQRRFRRLLAYSSIAHAGYMVFALVDTTGARVDGLLAYTAIYALGTIAACGAFAALCPEGEGDDDLARLDGAMRRRPVAAVVLACAVLSLAGVPPFPGFFAKLAIFLSVVDSGHLVPAILAFAGSFVGLAYYVGIVLRLVPQAPVTEAEET